MSKFLDELKDSVLSCDMEEKLPHRWVDNHEMVGSTIDMIDSLGENARRMIEIGIVQDELVKLGFESPYFGTFSYYPHPETCMSQQRVINVEFQNNFIRIADSSKECNLILYNNNYQQNILNTVKELIKWAIL